MKTATRRSVAKGAAWSAPLLVVGVAAPAYATSVVIPPKPTMALCKIKHNQQNTRWLLNFTFTFTSAANTFTIPNNTISLDGVLYAVTLTKLSANVWQVRTISSVEVDGLSGTVAFNYSVNGGPSTAFSKSYNTAGNYCP